MSELESDEYGCGYEYDHKLSAVDDTGTAFTCLECGAELWTDDGGEEP